MTTGVIVILSFAGVMITPCIIQFVFVSIFVMIMTMIIIIIIIVITCTIICYLSLLSCFLEKNCDMIIIITTVI